jgi:hypothetical protein
LMHGDGGRLVRDATSFPAASTRFSCAAATPVSVPLNYGGASPILQTLTELLRP